MAAVQNLYWLGMAMVVRDGNKLFHWWKYQIRSIMGQRFIHQGMEHVVMYRSQLLPPSLSSQTKKKPPPFPDYIL